MERENDSAKPPVSFEFENVDRDELLRAKIEAPYREGTEPVRVLVSEPFADTRTVHVVDARQLRAGQRAKQRAYLSALAEAEGAEKSPVSLSRSNRIALRSAVLDAIAAGHWVSTTDNAARVVAQFAEALELLERLPSRRRDDGERAAWFRQLVEQATAVANPARSVPSTGSGAAG